MAKLVCDKCGRKASTLTRLAVDGIDGPKLCGDCFSEAMNAAVHSPAKRLIYDELEERTKVLLAVLESLNDQEQVVIGIVRDWAGRTGEFEVLTRQKATKALVNVQSAQNNIRAAVAAMGEIPVAEPMPLLDGAGSNTA